MKKQLLFLLALLFLTLSACSSAAPAAGQNAQRNGDSFHARICSLEDEDVLVKAVEGEWVQDLSEEFRFSSAALPDIGALPGMYVNLVFAGTLPDAAPFELQVIDWFDISDQYSYPESVPAMNLCYDGNTLPISSFPPVEWNAFPEEDGALLSTIGCGAGPLEGGITPLTLPRKGDAPILLLSESMLPDQIYARAWAADILELPEAERLAMLDEAITLDTSGAYLFLPEDTQGYLVLATVVWNDKQDGRTPFGSSNYLFLLQSEAEH